MRQDFSGVGRSPGAVGTVRAGQRKSTRNRRLSPVVGFGGCSARVTGGTTASREPRGEKRGVWLGYRQEGDRMQLEARGRGLQWGEHEMGLQREWCD